MKYPHFITVLTIAFILFACEKTITISPPSYQSKPSIQGMLEPDSLPVIYFNRTVPYFDQKIKFSDLVIRNASVRISDGLNTYTLFLDSVFDRTYCQFNYFYKGSSPVQLNKTYTLTIINGGDTYNATASPVNLSKVTIDSTSYIPAFNDLYGEHEGVIVYFRDVPSQTSYFRYEMVRYTDSSTMQAGPGLPASTCLANGKDSALVHELGRSVYSDIGQNGLPIKIVIEPAYTHRKGTKGMIYIQTIDKNAFDFFDQLDKQKLAQFNPFTEPVFLKDGQFGNTAIGYFSAMARSKPAPFNFPE
jgi:hypothetical protein